MPSRSIRHRARHRRIEKSFERQRSSMMDVITIILVFILKSFSTQPSAFTSAKDLEMPYSLSDFNPEESLHLIISKKAILFEHEEVLRFRGGAFRVQSNTPNKLRIPELYRVLTEAKKNIQNTKRDALTRSFPNSKSIIDSKIPFTGILAIQADKAVPYSTLKKVMHTAAVSGFKVVRFLAARQEK